MRITIVLSHVAVSQFEAMRSLMGRKFDLDEGTGAGRIITMKTSLPNKLSTEVVTLTESDILTEQATKASCTSATADQMEDVSFHTNGQNQQNFQNN